MQCLFRAPLLSTTTPSGASRPLLWSGTAARPPVTAGGSKTVQSRIVPRAALKDVASAAADASGLTVKEAEAAVRAAFDFIAAELTKGERVTVAGFGSFERRERPERAGRNPRTGEALTIAARSAPAFVAAKALKDQVDGKK